MTIDKRWCEVSTANLKRWTVSLARVCSKLPFPSFTPRGCMSGENGNLGRSWKRSTRNCWDPISKVWDLRSCHSCRDIDQQPPARRPFKVWRKVESGVYPWSEPHQWGPALGRIGTGPLRSHTTIETPPAHSVRTDMFLQVGSLLHCLNLDQMLTEYVPSIQRREITPRDLLGTLAQSMYAGYMKGKK